ncbi:hypothetical protein [Paraburkholderia acidisoli]|uniref:Uncharacterized protein n=1 Tax=Paraburkholderia acidisoli TaxID=2571748 RepID=A0A7Z2JK86_9BURK|nr:hypothetical protein [Paraburkholderia acidisoli]QGZ66054.1 hypothetical protein FAZ98_30015 [Paraburkholderia acidisoli]
MLNNRKYIVGILVLIYVASLPFTGFCYRETNCWQGWGILAFGALGLLDGYQMSWLANVFLWLAWGALLTRSKTGDWGALASACFALLVGNAFLLQGVDTSEAGVSLEPVSSLGPGYALWMACQAATALVGAHGVLHRRSAAASTRGK